MLKNSKFSMQNSTQQSTVKYELKFSLKLWNLFASPQTCKICSSPKVWEILCCPSCFWPERLTFFQNPTQIAKEIKTSRVLITLRAQFSNFNAIGFEENPSTITNPKTCATNVLALAGYKTRHPHFWDLRLRHIHTPPRPCCWNSSTQNAARILALRNSTKI